VLTRSTKDGGFDLRLTFEEHGRKTTHLVEVKHWSAPSRPGSAVLQHFAHVVARETAEGGLLLSTSGFAENAAEGLTESEQRLLRLGNDTKVISLCKTYYKLNSEIWMQINIYPKYCTSRPSKSRSFEDTQSTTGRITDDAPA
jgi:hypothetical protein